VTTAMDAPYAAWIDCTDYVIVSASPELFFELSGDRICCRPMKGTAPRGMTPEADYRNRRMLSESTKDRAENVMIADMVRSDIGRVALPGTVRAEALFDIEKYRTVWQMTSTVTALTICSVTEIFRALFPSASVTGAPKVSSMKIIAALEDSARQIYTGAIGFMAPDRQARFNVAIRTALIEKKTGKGIYGVGGGIVWDSDPDDEFQECLNKARVLGMAVPEKEFRLLETMLWTPEGGFFLLAEHLDRLAGSADYFDFRFVRAQAEEHLTALAESLAPCKHRVRMLLLRTGEIHTEVQPLSADDAPCELRLALAKGPVDTQNPFLYHKTTQRDVYEKALAAAGKCDDVLLWNKSGNITESTIGNVVVRLNGQLFTPPVDCGLLAGTFRGKLLVDGVVRERKIAIAELNDAEAVYLVNSVRGWITCRLPPSLNIRGQGTGTASMPGAGSPS
jgi:para-aminobenzoate synthetase / 4-amino-4-deoxychorismate lyase